ncbi:hypothetical protein IFM89_000668 [Coptis chinensis]|uniref:Uncharacterized protein n=1 Tax=Coptis chinensis TaxID=261450 RepID=A0A835IJE8_9MAGN|nr:hypothetical protein IFM89_000668 [Coptis chinensis]
MSAHPEFRAGQLDEKVCEQYAIKGDDANRALLPEKTPFYEDLAIVVVHLSSFFALRVEGHCFCMQAPMIQHFLRA